VGGNVGVVAAAGVGSRTAIVAIARERRAASSGVVAGDVADSGTIGSGVTTYNVLQILVPVGARLLLHLLAGIDMLLVGRHVVLLVLLLVL
jgi:hypothetical protein